MIDESTYKAFFRDYVTNRLSDFYIGIGSFYRERGGNPDSLTYFENHWPRFEAMIRICLENGIKPDSVKQLCELGSFYPYTTYYYKMSTLAETKIDLYDIITREVADAEPYDVDGVRLIDFNLCTERLPDKQYDLIILSEVMEHLPINLVAFEKDVQRLIKPGGHIVVTYPLGGKNAKDYEKFYPERDFERLQEDHVREFTRETVKLFFKDLQLVAQRDVTYKAYGLITICLYQR